MISENDIIFFEGEKSLKWDKILKRIRDDPDTFVTKEGGWSAFADDEEALEAENEFENVNDSSFEEEELEVRQVCDFRAKRSRIGAAKRSWLMRTRIWRTPMPRKRTKETMKKTTKISMSLKSRKTPGEIKRK